jgi:hypothetical protein
MSQTLHWMIRGWFTGTVAVVFVVFLIVFRFWWTQFRGRYPAGTGVGIDVSLITAVLTPELGALLIVTFVLGFWLSRWLL